MLPAIHRSPEKIDWFFSRGFTPKGPSHRVPALRFCIASQKRWISLLNDGGCAFFFFAELQKTICFIHTCDTVCVVCVFTTFMTIYTFITYLCIFYVISHISPCRIYVTNKSGYICSRPTRGFTIHCVQGEVCLPPKPGGQGLLKPPPPPFAVG